MKITDVETILLCYRYEQDEKWKWSGGATLQRNCVLVRITVDDKYTGLGEIGESSVSSESNRNDDKYTI